MLKTTNKKYIHNQLLRLSLSITLITVVSVGQLEPAKAIPDMMKKMMSNKFKSADKNADGELTFSEAKAGGMPDRVLKRFDLIDVNKSRSISLKEMIVAFDSGAIKR